MRTSPTTLEIYKSSKYAVNGTLVQYDSEVASRPLRRSLSGATALRRLT